MIDQLHDAIKVKLDKVFEGKTYWTPSETEERIRKAIEVHPQYFAQSSYETKDEEYPYILLRTTDGSVPIGNNDDPGMVKVMIIIGIWDNDPLNQGYRDVLNIIHKITSEFAQSPVLGRYELVGPMEWVANDEDLHPFFIGVIETNWNYKNVEFQSNEHV